jgi:hypothetical protein
MGFAGRFAGRPGHERTANWPLAGAGLARSVEYRDPRAAIRWPGADAKMAGIKNRGEGPLKKTENVMADGPFTIYFDNYADEPGVLDVLKIKIGQWDSVDMEQLFSVGEAPFTDMVDDFVDGLVEQGVIAGAEELRTAEWFAAALEQEAAKIRKLMRK